MPNLYKQSVRLSFALLFSVWSIHALSFDADSLKKVVNENVSDSLKADAYNNLAKIYERQDPGLCLRYVDTAFYYSKRAGDDRLCGFSKLHQGIALNYLGRNDEALEVHYEALDYFEKGEEKNYAAGTHINIGKTLWSIGDFIKAKEHYKLAHQIMIELNDLKGLATVNMNLGVLSAIDTNYAEAEQYFNSAFYNYNELNDRPGQARIYVNLTQLYQIQGKFEKALSFAEKSIEINKEINDPYGLIMNYISLSDLFESMKDEKKSFDAMSKALDLALETDYLELKVDILGKRYVQYKKQGSYKEALEAYELHKAYKDTLLSAATQERIADLESVYENEQKAKEIEVLNKNAEIDALRIQENEATIEKDRYFRYFLFIGIFMLILVCLIVLYSYNNKKKANKAIALQKEKVEVAYVHLEEKNNEIMDSINYAKRIQAAILPSHKSFHQNLPNAFVIYKPKDVVAGDFYWMENKGDLTLIAAADCTGHGVPGAMVSVICNNGLNRSVREHGLTDPGKILDKTREIVIQEFEKSEDEVKDGMDIALCAIEKRNEGKFILKYAGAYNGLWILSQRKSIEVNGSLVDADLKDEGSAYSLFEVKADKQPIGKFENAHAFTTKEILLNSGDQFYLFSDGYADQFGGEKGKKFKSKNFKKLICSVGDLSMADQEKKILSHFENWLGNFEQVDDVCVLGIKL